MQLNSEEDVAAYLTAILEENDQALLAAAISDIARARGMSQLAKDSDLAREALYKALRPVSQLPRIEQSWQSSCKRQVSTAPDVYRIRGDSHQVVTQSPAWQFWRCEIFR